MSSWLIPFSNHAKLVSKCFPATPTTNSHPRPNRLSRLVFYANTRQGKLPKVCAYLESKVDSELSTNRAGSLKIIVDVLQALVDGCESRELISVAGFYLRIVSKICTKSRHPMLVSHAVSMLKNYCSKVSEASAGFSHREEFHDLWVALIGLSTYDCPDPIQMYELREAGLDGLTVLVAIEVPQGEILQKLWSAIITNLQLKEQLVIQSGQMVSKHSKLGNFALPRGDLTFPALSKQAELILATIVVQMDVVNGESIISALFAVFNDASYWTGDQSYLILSCILRNCVEDFRQSLFFTLLTTHILVTDKKEVDLIVAKVALLQSLSASDIARGLPAVEIVDMCIELTVLDDPLITAACYLGAESITAHLRNTEKLTIADIYCHLLDRMVRPGDLKGFHGKNCLLRLSIAVSENAKDAVEFSAIKDSVECVYESLSKCIPEDRIFSIGILTVLMRNAVALNDSSQIHATMDRIVHYIYKASILVEFSNLEYAKLASSLILLGNCVGTKDLVAAITPMMMTLFLVQPIQNRNQHSVMNVVVALYKSIATILQIQKLSIIVAEGETLCKQLGIWDPVFESSNLQKIVKTDEIINNKYQQANLTVDAIQAIKNSPREQLAQTIIDCLSAHFLTTSDPNIVELLQRNYQPQEHPYQNNLIVQVQERPLSPTKAGVNWAKSERKPSVNIYEFVSNLRVDDGEDALSVKSMATTTGTLDDAALKRQSKAMREGQRISVLMDLI